jgi:hypothetical protein
MSAPRWLWRLVKLLYMNTNSTFHDREGFYTLYNLKVFVIMKLWPAMAIARRLARDGLASPVLTDPGYTETAGVVLIQRGGRIAAWQRHSGGSPW